VDAISQFRIAMGERQIIPPVEIIADGNIHRCDAEGKNGRGDAAYLLHLDGVPAGGLENHRDGRGWKNWRADVGRRLSPQEEATHRARVDAMRRERETEDAQRKAEAREKAAAIWQLAKSAPDDHVYLIAKGTRAHGLRAYDGALVIPILDGAELHSLQFIGPDGEKRFLAGGRVNGCYYLIGEPNNALYVAEGFATGASVFEATGCAVAVAFNAGNLLPVARALRAKFPEIRLTICADDDANTPGNPGLTKAREAAQAVGAMLALPDFGSNRPHDASDFNDLHLLNGLGAVGASIERAGVTTAEEDTNAAGWRAVVQRLAKLPPLEYECVRKAEAKTLGIDRISVLDDEVKRARGDTEDSSAGQALTFPDVEPWEDSVNGADVLTEIKALCRRFLHLPKNADIVVPLWVALTYVTESFDCLPLLFVTAPEKGCGKSTVLDLIQLICARPLSASNITGAALFRTVEMARPTLLLDEVDSFLSENEEMRGIINSGHSRGAAFVVRVVGEDHEPRKFSTWCAKAIAGIGRLPGTIEDRALIVTMQRLAPGEKVEKLRRVHRFPDLRRKLTRWANDHREALQAARPMLPDFLSNRAADNWESLFAIAAAAGGDWPTSANEAARTLTGSSQTADSVGIELLVDIAEAFNTSGCDRLTTVRLIERLTADDTARWVDYSRGRPITAAQIAKLLKRYGIAPSTVRVGDSTAKGYRREQFADVFVRYLPASPPKTVPLAVTTSQACKNTAFSDSAGGHMRDDVAAAECFQALDPPALLPCDGFKTQDPAHEANRWRMEL
jgi:putative DNA primase/helicase